WKVVLSERVYIPRFLVQERLGSVRKFILIWLIRTLYRKATMVTANSRRSVRFLSKFVGGSPVYAHLPNAIDVDIANKLAMVQPEIPPLEVGGPHILAVGRLDYQKGFDLLLEAMALIRRHYPWQLVLVGDGPEQEHLRDLAYSLGISQAVQWIGAVRNPFPYYQWADLVVSPSRFEGFPNVALEAMSCAKTVICTNCKTGPSELTLNGRYGVLVREEDPHSLAEAIVKWGQDKEGRALLGAMAENYIRNAHGATTLKHALTNDLCLAN